MKWTPSQERAIVSRDAELLVGASAGSGKTTIMIERIFQLLKNKEVCLDELLVLTFTKASASDMRIKLRRKLEKAGAEFAPMLLQLPSVAMGNFHQFCSRLVQTYFSVADVNPSFAIIDDIDAKALQSNVLDKVIARNYDKCAKAIDALCATRSTEPLKELIIHIYNFLCSRDDGETWLRDISQLSYNTNLVQNLALQNILCHYKKMGENFHEKFAYHYSVAEKEGADKLLSFVIHAKEVSKRFFDIMNFGDVDFATLRKVDCSIYDEFKSYRDELKKEIKTIQDYLSIDEKTMVQRLRNDGDIVAQIVFLVAEFIEDYSSEKQRLGKLDFADLEKYALKILGDKGVCSQLRGKYKYIFVDEYQDTNPVQDRILAMLRGESCFLVGDVKQSIYGFRGAEPRIFASKLDGKGGEVVSLNENFRSHPNILEFVNEVFSHIMAGYKTNSRFNSGAKFPEIDEQSVEVILIDTKKEKEEKSKEKKVVDKPYDILKDDSVQDDLERVEAECAIVAKKIDDFTKRKVYDLELKKSRKVRLSDIAVIARNSTHFNALTKTLTKAGIESVVAIKNKASELYEIALLENFLFAISNFHNDIPLVLTMTNFVFGFTNDEMALVKIHSLACGGKVDCCGMQEESKCKKTQVDFLVLGDENKLNKRPQETSFYEKIINYIDSESDELSCKLKNFVGTLNEFNSFCKSNSVVATLTKFLTQFQVIEKLLITPNGETMVANIHSYMNALSTSRHNESLPRFLYLLEHGHLAVEISSGGSIRDRVQIMTIHKSKGLEFPIVILFDMGAKFSNVESRKFLTIDRDLGLCMHSVDMDEYTKNLSIARLSAKINAKKIQIDEEMRLLYVAMTRAKNNLVVMGSCDVAKLKKGEVLQTNTYLDFLAQVLFSRSTLSSRVCGTRSAGTVLDTQSQCASRDFSLQEIKLGDVKVLSKEKEQRVLSGDSDPKLVEKLRSAYKKEEESILGADVVLKNSVTSLTKNEETTIDFMPRKMFGEGSEDRGIDYGTKFHSIMQRIDLTMTEHEDKNIVKCLEVLRPIIKDKKVLREVPFLQELDKDGVKILVQGIIDMLVIKNDRAVLIDYKTTRANEQKIIEIYKPQMQMYKNAISMSSSGVKKVDVLIYSTHLGKLIDIN